MSPPAERAPVDYYAALGVPIGATAGQIDRAYRKLAFRWHPDRNRGREKLAHEQFVRLQEAYRTLADPALRRAYDALRLRAVFAPERAAPAARRARSARPPAKRRAAGARPRAGAAASAAPSSPRPGVLRRAAEVLLFAILWIAGVLVRAAFGPRVTRDDRIRYREWLDRLPLPVSILFRATSWITRAGMAAGAVMLWPTENGRLDIVPPFSFAPDVDPGLVVLVASFALAVPLQFVYLASRAFMGVDGPPRGGL